MSSRKIKNQLRDQKSAIIKKFMNDLNYIFEAGKNKLKNDVEFEKVRNQFLVARRNNPEDLVKLSGPPMWEYREQISKGEVGFFLEHDFSEDVQKFGSTETESISKEDFDQTVELISSIRKAWIICTEGEKKLLTQKVQNMLKSYAEYLMTDKKLIAME